MTEPNIASLKRPLVRNVSRPWGSFRQYVHNASCTVSLMVVQPGERLSLQSHSRRAELWIVLDGGAEVMVGEDVLRPAPGDEIWIDINQQHRLSGVGEAPARVLEIAFGDWQQDDITRFDDDYCRVQVGE